ncbi:MAG: bacillithiol biosynthesis deacetylase BshB1 [Planctomycetes bacterium]|nr:bacillithiol biosynthesis deacetylase BshB1 [Planctomycetota bacterium]
MTKPIDLLVVAAHPDDAELGIGGTLLVAKRLGYRTGIIDLSRGELSSRGDPATRAAETEAASRLLELDHRENFGLPDGAIRDDDRARALLAGAIRRLRPRVLLAPWREDLHADHAGAGLLVERTHYLGGAGKFAPGGEPHRAHVVGYYMHHTPFVPSIVIDITAVWQRRLEVMRAYRSQFHQEGVSGPATKISQPHFPLALEGRARHYGFMAGCEFGEPIRWELPPLVADPVSLAGAWMKRP